MTNKCNKCEKPAAIAEGVKCDSCGSLYHRACVGGAAGAGDRWRCAACEPPAGPGRAGEPQEADAGFPHSLAREIRLLRDSVTREMGSMRLELSRLNAVLADFGRRLDGVEGAGRPRAGVEAAGGGAGAAGAVGGADVAAAIARLRLELDEREQESYANDVEIGGLEERAGEDLAAAVLQLGARAGVPLEERDVVSAERRGWRGAGGGRPRPVVARLARRALRDGLVRAARAGRGVPWAGAAGGRLHVRERLTAANRLLLYRAREAARRAGWRCVWARGGRVFARLGDRASVRRVRSLLDLAALFPAPA